MGEFGLIETLIENVTHWGKAFKPKECYFITMLFPIMMKSQEKIKQKRVINV